MLPLIEFAISLEARDPSRNLRRSYQISAGQDLLGDWVVETRYGRIGGKGRSLKAVAPGEEAAMNRVRAILKRRANAPKRIGVPYLVRDLAGSLAADWLSDFECVPGDSIKILSPRAGG
jgi:hypothetical protein